MFFNATRPPADLYIDRGLMLSPCSGKGGTEGFKILFHATQIGILIHLTGDQGIQGINLRPCALGDDLGGGIGVLGLGEDGRYPFGPGLVDEALQGLGIGGRAGVDSMTADTAKS